jgi:hypothetical protein
MFYHTSELSIEHRLKNFQYTMFIQVGLITPLLEMTELENGIRIGSSVTLTNFAELLRHYVSTLPQSKVLVHHPCIK